MNPAQKKAQTIARQIAQEPLEILKTAREQTGTEKPPEVARSSNEEKPQEQKHKEDEVQDKLKSQRLVAAFDRELEDMAKENLFKDLQRRIAQGEEIPLEDFRELTLEQKQVLNSQMEAVRNQKNQVAQEPLVEPLAKKGRRLFNFGKKQEVKRQQTRVENIVPPSG